jgi:putative endonuclease
MAGRRPGHPDGRSNAGMAAFVSMMSNKRYGTLYTGVTSDLIRRAWEHRTEIIPGFTSRYGLHRLVYYEQHESIVDAIQREHNIKHWPRSWKTKLVDELIPDWDDLYPAIAHG